MRPKAEPILVELVILTGLQGSGKSTFRRQRFPDHAVVSKDLMRNNQHKERRQRQLIGEALAEGRSVVVDNTNPRPDDRAPLVAIGREYGARVVGYYFDIPFRVCFRRNAARSGHELVPELALFVTRKRLRVPTRVEGFDEIWRVRTREGGFEVEPLALA